MGQGWNVSFPFINNGLSFIVVCEKKKPTKKLCDLSDQRRLDHFAAPLANLRRSPNRTRRKKFLLLLLLFWLFFGHTALHYSAEKKSFEWIRMTEIWSTSQPLNKMLFKLELAKNATPWVDGCKNASSLSRWTLVTRTSGAPPANSPSLGGKATNRGSDNLQHLLFSQYLTLHL